jgi:type IV pilus assembly protein PilA
MRRVRQGFTLVELMIVVAIIGILAAIAVPSFVKMQWRAKRAEVPSNVDGVKTAQLAYDAGYDQFIIQAALHPTTTAGKSTRSWPTGSNFDTLGWTPDGDVRGQYKVSTTSTTDFLVTGRSDVDGDSTFSTYTARKSVNAAMTTGQTIY